MMLPAKSSSHAALLALSLATPFTIAEPAHAGTTPGNATTTIVQPLSLVINDNLDFGTIISGTTAGTVTVASNGTRRQTGGIVLANVGRPKPAVFSGQSAVNQSVDISLGANTVVLTGPGAPMRMRNFLFASMRPVVLSGPARFIVTNTNGLFAFSIGATLDVGANQVPGKYTANWPVTLNYP